MTYRDESAENTEPVWMFQRVRERLIFLGVPVDQVELNIQAVQIIVNVKLKLPATI